MIGRSGYLKRCGSMRKVRTVKALEIKQQDGPDGNPHHGEALVTLAPVHINIGVTLGSTGLALLNIMKLSRVAACCLADPFLYRQFLAVTWPRGSGVWLLSVGAFRGLVCAVIGCLHTEIIRVIFIWQSGTVQWLRPFEVKLLHDWRTLLPCLLTHYSARWDGCGYLLSAHGSVERAQEKLQMTVTAELN